MNHPATAPDTRNLILAIALATAVMLGWQYFYERPRMEAARVAAEAQQAAKARDPQQQQEKPVVGGGVATSEAPISRHTARVKINTPSLHGSLSLVGARFDDLTLANYRETEAADAPEVKLLSPLGTTQAYFAETGMLAAAEVRVPDATTVWQASGKELTEKTPITLSWNNGAGLTFEKKISVDEKFMFTIEITVKNAGGPVTLYPYGLISRNYVDNTEHFAIMHEGPLGVMNQVLEDASYKNLREDGAKEFKDARGWVGITDKYWLTALVPEAEATFDGEFKHFKRGEADAYQSHFRSAPLEVPAAGSASVTTRFFAGAKVVEQLDAYGAKYSIPLFDRAVDFGALYFLTKPIFGMLTWFHSIVGNFGVAILLLTVVIKALLFPLASKSMTAMARMKQLTPKMQEIRERYANDKMRMNQEIMAMYKREKVNPVAGCLPILLQIPVFFALYKVLFVTIEMRHAPFFGWIHDLSAVDPSNLFTLFGLIPWDAPSFMHLGVWPMIMCATMVIQQRLSPKPADEVQAMVMNYMPFMFLFLFAGFPAGLVIYWAWNNALTILQMLYINHGLAKKGLK